MSLQATSVSYYETISGSVSLWHEGVSSSYSLGATECSYNETISASVSLWHDGGTTYNITVSDSLSSRDTVFQRVNLSYFEDVFDSFQSVEHIKQSVEGTEALSLALSVLSSSVTGGKKLNDAIDEILSFYPHLSETVKEKLREYLSDAVNFPVVTDDSRVDVFPVDMTSNTTPSPYVISASEYYTPWGGYPWKTFNSVVDESGSYDGWHVLTPSEMPWIEVDLSTPTTMNSYSMSSDGWAGSYQIGFMMPKDWTLLGSNDESSWVTLDTRTNQSWQQYVSETRYFELSSQVSYRYYRFLITKSTWGSSSPPGQLSIGRIQFYIKPYPNMLMSWVLKVHSILDALDLSSYANSPMEHFGAVAEVFGVYEATKLMWSKYAAETLSTSDSAKGEFFRAIYEYLSHADAISSKLTAGNSLSESLSIIDRAIRFIEAISRDILSSTDAAKSFVYLSLTERIVTSIAITHVARMGLLASDSLILPDVSRIIFDKNIADQIAGTDSLYLRLVAYAMSADSTLCSDTSSYSATLNFIVNEPALLNEVLSPRIKAGELIDDILYAKPRMTISLSGDSDIYHGWVLTGDQIAASLYTNMPFNSFASYDSSIFGANESGIYRLEGTTDDGTTINSGIMVNLSDFDSRMKKRINTAYFGISGSRPMIKFTSDDKSVSYYIIENRARVSRGQDGVEWSFSLTRVDEIDFIEIAPIILSRR